MAVAGGRRREGGVVTVEAPSVVRGFTLASLDSKFLS